MAGLNKFCSFCKLFFVVHGFSVFVSTCCCCKKIAEQSAIKQNKRTYLAVTVLKLIKTQIQEESDATTEFDTHTVTQENKYLTDFCY